jgi:transposase
MPWKERGLMNERLKFIGRLLQGEKMVELCREFGISRKTGYEFWDRYQKVGLYGLGDRSRLPYRYANQLPLQVEQEILRIKREKPSWGAPKIREILARRYPEIHSPAKSTIHCILDRHGLVTRHQKKRFKSQGTPLVSTQTPNDLWCADFKGEFTLADRRYCYPLTLTDFPAAICWRARLSRVSPPLWKRETGNCRSRILGVLIDEGSRIKRKEEMKQSFGGQYQRTANPKHKVTCYFFDSEPEQAPSEVW